MLAFWLATGLLVAIFGAAVTNERRAEAPPLDAASLLELSRRLDVAVSGAMVPPRGASLALPAPSPGAPRDPR